MDSTKDNLDRKVIIIGLDGATFDLILPWVDEGKLPNIEKLIKFGVNGELRSVIPTISAPAWTSFMTGKNPGKHGVLSFLVYSDNSYFEEGNPPVISSHLVKAKTLWEILSEEGKKVGVINVPVTYPPKKVNGFLISGFLTPPSAKVFTYPEELGSEIKDYKIEIGHLRELPILGRNFQLEKIKKQKEAFEMLEEQYEVTEKRAATTLKLMEKWDTEFLMVVFRGTDSVQHQFWEEKDVLLGYWKKIDEIVGKILKKASENTNIFIMSDHGFGPAPRKILFINTWLSELGMLRTKKGLTSRSFMNLYKIGMKFSTKLIGATKLYLILPKKLYRKVINKSQGYIDWNETIAYGEDKGVRGINIINFEGEEEYEKRREKIISSLKMLKDPETGEKVISEAYKKEEIYSGRFIGQISDIVILPNPNYIIGQLFSDTIIKHFKPIRAGDHFAHPNGIFIAYGHDVKKDIKIANATIYDLAPTILHTFGVPIPKDMDGRVLVEIFDDDSELAKRPIRYEEVEEKEWVKEKIRALKKERKI